MAEKKPERPAEPERWIDLSMFWREPTLWPVTFCVVGGFSALGAGAVSMALTQRNPFARMALVVAAALTVFALFDARSRRGKIAGLATLAGVLWALSLGGGFVLARLGD